MFTGIIETTGRVISMESEGTNIHLEVESDLAGELKVDQSLAHDGVCLTVVKCNKKTHIVTAVEETLKKTTLGGLKPGQHVNIERCMPANGRFDGHIVQGHVDQIGECISIEEKDGSWIMRFEYDNAGGNVTVEKGSICINGISLTCYDSTENAFSVAIIPYTYEHTTLKTLKVGDEVNMEFDVIGKYVKRMLADVQL